MHDFETPPRFPNLTPITKPPTLWTVNGIGTGMYGSRDHDPETGTYIKTLWVCLLFIPVWALRAYRVADAHPGWYFLGREPLGGWPRAWNRLLVLAAVAAVAWVGWQQYTDTPEYRAGQTMARADRLAAEGDIVPAAELYAQVAQGATSKSADARESLAKLVRDKVDSARGTDAARVLSLAADLHLDGLTEPALRAADKLAAADPDGALAVLDVAGRFAFGDDGKAVADRRRTILEQLVADEPANVDRAVQLCLAYEAEGQRAKCEQLLEPHRAELGGGEGGRILGQVYAGQGKVAEALALLEPYTSARLARYRENSRRLSDEVKAIQGELQSGQARDFPYDRYSRAGQDEQAQLVNEYFQQALRNNPVIQSIQEETRRDSAVVPAAMDVGMLLLQRAQTAADPDARTADLKKAEETFLAVRDAAGESDQFRLGLGQVYYWLGKFEDGKGLLAKVLEDNGRTPQVLLAVSQVYRQLGEQTEARALAEESYEKAADDGQRYAAALQRSMMFTDQDDQIAWMEKCDLRDDLTRADLLRARGFQALAGGKQDEAAGRFREAIAIYEKRPDSAENLNNNAISYLGLYGAGGDRAALDKALGLLQQAVRLRPNDTVLLRNVADTVLEAALRDGTGDAVDLERLRMQGSFPVLAYLYLDEAGRDKVFAKVRDHVGLKQARKYYERGLVLSPKSPHVYDQLLSVAEVAGDRGLLADLKARLDKVDVETSQGQLEFLQFIRKANDQKYLTAATQVVAHDRGNLGAAREAGGPTFAVVAASLARDLTALSMIDGRERGDEIVELAEQAHAAAPSDGTRVVLMNALLERAARRLAGAEAGFQAIRAKSERSLTGSYQVAVALGGEDDALAGKVLADPDVKRAIELARKRVNDLPGECTQWYWAMLRRSDPETAGRVAERLKTDEKQLLTWAINCKLKPADPYLAVRAHWMGQITGDMEQADAIRRHAAARGVPLPIGE